MMRIAGLIGALALFSIAPAMAADASGYGMYGIKIAVKDFQKAIDFYTVLGMKMGPKHNDHEWELKWDNPAQGSAIILVKSERGSLKPGGSFMMMQVPDAKATAAKLRQAGYPGVGEPKVGERSAILMLKDPDGNGIEMLSPPPK